MSQSSILRKQRDDLAELALQFGDNVALRDQIDKRIDGLERTLIVIEAMEQRQAEETAMKAKLNDVNDVVGKRIDDAVEMIGQNAEEKKQVKATLQSMSMVDTKALDTLAYLKDKKLPLDKIKLVLQL